jgi:hypothetical protein
MKTDFISVNDYKKNKNILWETYYEMTLILLFLKE